MVSGQRAQLVPGGKLGWTPAPPRSLVTWTLPIPKPWTGDFTSASLRFPNLKLGLEVLLIGLLGPGGDAQWGCQAGAACVPAPSPTMSWAWPFWKEPPESPLPSSWRSTTRHFTASWTWGVRAEAVDGQPAPRDRDARKVRLSPTRAAFQRGAALPRMHTGPRAVGKGLQCGRGCS